MADVVEVTGLKELIQRMQAFPVKLAQVVATAMAASLNVLWEKVPPYPPPPPDSTYRRTGTLGRSLGSSMGGGASGGEPSIYSIRKLGQGNMEGKFGTNLNYAPYVIGTTTQTDTHMSNGWWRIRTIAARAEDKIASIWQGVGKQLANFLEGRGLL